MRNLIIGLVVGLFLGMGGFALFDKGSDLDLSAALRSGGLSIQK